MNLHIYIEVQQERGQDASAWGENYVFALDGLGGTGGILRTNAAGGSEVEAKIASVATAKALNSLIPKRWSVWDSQKNISDEDSLVQWAKGVADEIRLAMKQTLRDEAEKWNAAGGKLPTTLSGWILFPLTGGKTLALALWAGDSRCYAIDERCMKLYTRDHVADTYYLDPMEELLAAGSPSMNNRLGIDMDFWIDYKCVIIDRPTFLFACTDGLYGGVVSPMHLEYYLRLLGAESSPESMAEVWQGFFVSQGMLQDDSACLEGVFIGSEKNDFQVYQQMLLAPMAELESKYISAYPEEEKAETVDVDGMIGTLGRNLCKAKDFHSILKNSILRAANSSDPFPADIPCAQVIRQLRSEVEIYQENRQKKSRKLNDDLRLAEEEFNTVLSRIELTEVSINETPCSYSENAFRKLRTGKQDDFLWDLKEWIGEDLDTLRKYCEPIQDFDRRRGKKPSEMDVTKAVSELMCNLKDALLFVSKVFGGRGARVVEGEPKLICRQMFLTSVQQNQVRSMFLSLVSGERIVLEESLKQIKLKASDISALYRAASNYWESKRAVECYVSEWSAEPTLNAAVIDNFLRGRPHADVRYMLEKWYHDGSKPTFFDIPAELENIILSNLNTIRQRANSNDQVRKAHDEFRQKCLAIWNVYKPDFEAWNDPVNLPAQENPAPAEPVEETWLVAEPEPAMEVLASAEPTDNEREGAQKTIEDMKKTEA